MFLLRYPITCKERPLQKETDSMKKYKVMTIVAYLIATVVTVFSLVSGKIASLGFASAFFAIGALLSVRKDDTERDQRKDGEVK